MENTTTNHAVRISARGPKYRVTCDTCGPVGAPQEYEDDAEAIAARHHEVGGFEP